MKPTSVVRLGVANIIVLSAIQIADASAEPVRLSLTTMSPANSRNVTAYFEPYAKRVNAAGNGELAIELKHGQTIASFANVIDRVMTDVIQIGWANIQSSGRGQLSMSEVPTLPFLYDDPVPASVAYWRLYKSGALGAEIKDYHPLWVMVSGNSAIHFASKPSSMDDLGGAKVNIVGGQVSVAAVTQLGGRAMSIPTVDTYQALQRRMVDSVLIGWTAFGPYKLAEVTKYHVMMPIGNSAFMMFMDKAKYDKLPAAVRKLLDDNGGEAESRNFARYFQLASNDFIEEARNSKDHEVVNLTAAQREKWRQKVAPIVEKWLEDRPGSKKVRDEFLRLVAQTRAEK
jgi:TRAP-type C4-dicarboxylate transport system substrate-binding protein